MSAAGDSLGEMLARHAIDLPAEQVERLGQFATLLWEWNAKLNLTRHTDYEKFVSRDLVDSLAFTSYLQKGEKVLDVGTGGGVPGVILAIVRPDLRIALSESTGKKARAVADIVERLGLRTAVYANRAEEVLAAEPFNTLVVRAVAPLLKLLTWFKPHWNSFDRLLILKGPAWVDERGEARHHGAMGGLALRKLAEYPLPGTSSQSVLLQICRQTKLIGDDGCELTPRS